MIHHPTWQMTRFCMDAKCTPASTHWESQDLSFRAFGKANWGLNSFLCRPEPNVCASRAGRRSKDIIFVGLLASLNRLTSWSINTKDMWRWWPSMMTHGTNMLNMCHETLGWHKFCPSSPSGPTLSQSRPPHGIDHIDPGFWNLEISWNWWNHSFTVYLPLTCQCRAQWNSSSKTARINHVRALW